MHCFYLVTGKIALSGQRRMLHVPSSSNVDALHLLEQQVAREMETMRYPGKPWMKSPHGLDALGRDGKVVDVLIVGGGQSGLAVAFALKRMCIDNIQVIDQQPDGLEGPWLSFARMQTLRTPKHLIGVENGIPSLSAQSWYIARFGRSAWDQLYKISREHWAQYLQWFKEVTALPVSNETKLVSFALGDDSRDVMEALLSGPDGERVVRCRRLVLATGSEGSGRWYVPPFIADALAGDRYAHTCQAIDFEKLKGKRIGVLGAGASAFDNAGTALEHGAASVDLFYRRDRLPRINPFRWSENRGFLEHYADLDDRWKWRFFELMLRDNQPPPQETYDRCAAHDTFTLHPAEPWKSVYESADQVVVSTNKQTYAFDFIIVGTGFIYDAASRPELAPYAHGIAVWGDRIAPGDDLPANATMASMPYLGPNFEYMEKTPGALPWAGKVYNYTFGAGLSLGIASAALSGLRFGVDRLASGIAGSLFAEDVEAQFQSLSDFCEPELVIDDRY